MFLALEDKLKKIPSFILEYEHYKVRENQHQIFKSPDNLIIFNGQKVDKLTQ